MKQFWRWTLVGFGLSLVLVGEPSFPRRVRSNPSMTVAQRGDWSDVEQMMDAAKQLKVQGKYAEAILLMERAVAIARKTLSPQDPKLAISLGWLADLYRAQGQYAKAEPLYQQSLEILRQALGENHPRMATTLNNLGLLYQSQGQYAKAEPRYQEALKIVRQTLGDKHPYVASTLNNLAVLNKLQGHYSKAERFYQEALKIDRLSLGDNHPHVATTLNNLANLYVAQGRYSQAEPLFQKALKIDRLSLGDNHPHVASTLSNLANLYVAQGRYSQAEPLYQQAVEIVRQALGDNHPQFATTLNGLAVIYLTQGQYSKAEPLYQEVLKIMRQDLGNDHPLLAKSLNNLSSLYLAQGQYSKAEPLYLEALKIKRQALGKDHPSIATTLNNLFILNWAQNNIPSARQHLQVGLDIEETNLIANLTSGDEAQKKAFLGLYQYSTNLALSFHLQGVPQNKAISGLAYTTFLRRKGRLLDVLGASYTQLLNSSDSQVKLQLQNLQTTRSQIATLTTRGPGTNEQEQQAYLKQLQNLSAKKNRLTQELLELRPNLDENLNPDKVQIPAVQQAIPADAALLDFAEYRPFNPRAKLLKDQWGAPRYAVYVLTRSGSLQWKDLGPVSEIQGDLTAFINAVQSESISKKGLQTIASPLYHKIFQPIRQMVSGKKHILISPDGELNRIPFEALIDKENKYLIESFQFTYLSSGRDLLKINPPQPKNLPQAQPALLLAGPDYDTKNKTLPPKQISQTPSTYRSTQDSSTRSAALANLTFNFIEGANEEGEAIAAINKLDFDSKYGPDATESLLKQWPNPRILHIATHGIFLEKTDRERTKTPPIISPIESQSFASRLNQSILNTEPLLRSGLVLAGFNNQTLDTEVDNGLLTAYEVTGLDLRATQMVVMSACQTGAGEIKSGDGVYGLRRAFTLAGAQSQVMSLWDVGDDSTQKLMVAYYQRLSDGKARGAALRQVQLDMLNGKFNDSTQDINYTAPNHWAAFIRTGDWRPLQ